MTSLARAEQLRRLFPDEPTYRLRQMEEALFNDRWSSWSEVTALPAAMRSRLAADVPWVTYTDTDVHAAKSGDVFKALLALADGNRIETVLMKNRRDQWTVCVSSQVGCAMKCAFCATGKLGLKRNLTSDEIADQYRFWQSFITTKMRRGEDTEMRSEKLRTSESSHLRISNVVFMGMGEPLANYENVKAAIRTLLKNTDLGPTRVTVSTAGLIPQLEALLEDKDWPDVRLAVSLHSADARTRQSLMPSSYEDFLDKLQNWALRYLDRHGDRRHHLTFEDVMLAGVNDSPEHAAKLARFARSLERVKINLIPFNWTDTGFRGTAQEDIEKFLGQLEAAGVTATVRKSLGDDIAAACGQLAAKS